MTVEFFDSVKLSSKNSCVFCICDEEGLLYAYTKANPSVFYLSLSIMNFITRMLVLVIERLGESAAFKMLKLILNQLSQLHEFTFKMSN